MLSKFLVNTMQEPFFSVLALLIFFAIFMGMLILVFKNKESYWRSISLLPLDKEASMNIHGISDSKKEENWKISTNRTY